MNFLEWLRTQIAMPDMIGDLAKDALNDAHFPNTDDYKILFRYLEGTNAEDALRRAYREWRDHEAAVVRREELARKKVFKRAMTARERKINEGIL